MRSLPLLLLGMVLISSATARATPNFPAAIAGDLQLSTPPACTVCHATNEGGAGTATKPFAKYLVSRGLAPFDESSLAGALAAAGGEHHDSDGDGVSDIDALQRGLDPNGNPSQTPHVEDPQFGCNAGGRGGGSLWPPLLALGLRVGASLLARRYLKRTMSHLHPTQPG